MFHISNVNKALLIYVDMLRSYVIGQLAGRYQVQICPELSFHSFPFTSRTYIPCLSYYC